MNVFKKTVKISCAFVLAVALSGCMINSINVDAKQICNEPVEIHMVGVSHSDARDVWSKILLSDYWKPTKPGSTSNENTRGQNMRIGSKDYRLEMKVGLGEGCQQIFRNGKGDERARSIWKTWKADGVEFLVVLVDWPKKTGLGNQKPRCFPLSGDCWKGGVMDIRIESASIRVVGQKRDPECQCD